MAEREQRRPPHVVLGRLRGGQCLGCMRQLGVVERELAVALEQQLRFDRGLLFQISVGAGRQAFGREVRHPLQREQGGDALDRVARVSDQRSELSVNCG